MSPNARATAVVVLSLIFPAALFLSAVAVRSPHLLHGAPAHAAQHIVAWYTDRRWTLWVLLIALPLCALLVGGMALLRDRVADTTAKALPVSRPHAANRVVVAGTFGAAVILMVVGLHMLAN